MNFALIPAGNEDTASSRIRVYSLQRALTALGHAVGLNYSADSDVLFIQKSATWGTYEIARLAKARGCTVLYDVDDLGEALWYFVGQRCFYEMICLADVVTTDTEGHREYLVRKCGIKRVEIIADTIDYYPSSPVRVPIQNAKPFRIFWFGCGCNITLFEKYAQALTAISEVEVVVATDPSVIPKCSGKYPQITFVPWSRSLFLSQLQSCHLSCLMHDGSPYDRSKSNNKMISSITWGVPAVVSRTPEYERTAREAGIENALFSDEHELLAAIERLRPAEARVSYLNKAQPDIWTRYCPEAVATRFLNVASQCARATKSQPNTAGAPALSAARGTPAIKRDYGLMYRLKGRASFDLWRLRFADDRLGIFRSISREAVVRSRNKLFPSLRPGKVAGPAKSQPRLQRDSARDWVNPEGIAYRMKVYERQRTGGPQPLVDNPSAEEVRNVLRSHQAKTVLEVGCGWGRLLEQLTGEFDAEGCNVSPDMLKLCPATLKTFFLDIAVDNYSFLGENAGRWEVLFTRGVMLYFMETQLQMAYAMNNMLMLASKTILIWEWPEVCDRMRYFSSSSKFEYHPIEHRSE